MPRTARRQRGRDKRRPVAPQWGRGRAERHHRVALRCRRLPRSHQRPRDLPTRRPRCPPRVRPPHPRGVPCSLCALERGQPCSTGQPALAPLGRRERVPPAPRLRCDRDAHR
jgi:hypothetical protein